MICVLDITPHDGPKRSDSQWHGSGPIGAGIDFDEVHIEMIRIFRAYYVHGDESNFNSEPAPVNTGG